MLSIAVRLKTLGDMTPTFLSNLMFYYSSYFLYSSPTDHFSVPWLCCSVSLPGKFCVHTPPSILILQIWALQGSHFGHNRLGEVQNMCYMFSCTFSLLICMSIWLFPLIIFKSDLSQTLYLFCLPLHGHQLAQWRGLSDIKYSYNKWIWLVFSPSWAELCPLKVHVLTSSPPVPRMCNLKVIKIKWDHMVGPKSDIRRN